MYKQELKEFLNQNLNKGEFEIFEVRQGFLIRHKNTPEPVCFKFSNLAVIRAMKENIELTKEEIFDGMLKKIKSEFKVN